MTDSNLHGGLYKEIQFYATVFAGVTASYSLYSALRQQQKINKMGKKINQIQSKPVYSPTSLLNEFKSQNVDVLTNLIQKNFKPIRELNNKVKEYRGDIFLMGNVGIPQGFKGLPSRNSGYFSKGPSFVLKMDYKQDIFSNDSGDPSRGKYKIDLNRILQSAHLEYIPRFLVSDSQSSVTISNYDKINYSKALDITYVKQQKRSLHIHEFVFTLGLLGLKFITELFFKNIEASSFRGVSIGIRDSQIGIKIGSGIAVIGELIYDIEKNEMKMDFPELIVGDRLSYLNSLKNQLNELVYNRNVFFIIGAVAGLYSLRRLFKYLQKQGKLPKMFDGWRA